MQCTAASTRPSTLDRPTMHKLVTVYAQSDNVIQRIRRRRSKKFPATFQDKRPGNFHTVLEFGLGASVYFPILQTHLNLYGAEFGLVLQTHDTQLSRYNPRVPRTVFGKGVMDTACCCMYTSGRLSQSPLEVHTVIPADGLIRRFSRVGRRDLQGTASLETGKPVP